MPIRRFAALLLTLTTVLTPGVAHSQVRPDSPPDWANVLAAETDPRVTVTDCPTSAFFNATICVNGGMATLDGVTYGDIAGDGGLEAVIGLASGAAHGGVSGWLVYRLTDLTPQLVDASHDLAMFVNIDATAGTLNAESVGPDNQGAFCCLTSMGRVTYKLIGDSLVRQGTCTYDPRVENGPCTPVADNPPALSEAPASTGTPDLNSVKSGFPGQLLMPPPGVLPFASLQLSFVTPQLQLASVTTGKVLREYPQSFGVSFRDPHPLGQFGLAGAGVAGAISPQMYDDTSADSLKTFAGCAPTAAYCARPNFPPCTGIPCTLQAELFRGLKVKGADALVQHVREEKEWRWSVTWVDSQAGATYILTTANAADPADSDKGLSAKNLAGAQQLVAVAERLVPWTGT